VTDVEQPPHKVKLTLRLKPLAQVRLSVKSADLESDSESGMSVDSPDISDDDLDGQFFGSRDASPYKSCLPPYPHRPSVSIPPYIPAYQPSHRSRSPSVPYSAASPPPDSDDDEVDEVNGFHVSMTDPSRCRRRYSALDFDQESDFGDSSSDEDEDSFFRSGSLSAPDATPLDASTSQFVVKEEAADIETILEAWDERDNQYQPEFVKVVSSGVPPSFMIKKEELVDPPLPWGCDWYSDPSSPASSSSSSPPDITLSKSSVVIKKEEEEEDTMCTNYDTVRRPRAQTVPVPESSVAFLTQPVPRKVSEGLPTLTSLFDARRVIKEEPSIPCMSPLEMHTKPIDGSFFTVKAGGISNPYPVTLDEKALVVKTCFPCEPEIVAAQLEGQLQLTVHIYVHHLF
jgi:hypothetical protein